MVTITAKNGEILNLGHQGENKAVTVRFPIADWQEWYGDGEASLINKRTTDPDGYPCAVTVSGGYAYWEVTNADTAYKGRGECQLTYTVNGTEVKTNVYQTFVDKSLGASEDPPLPWQGWIDKINNNSAKQKIECMNLQALSDYLYYVELSDWDYEDGKKHYESNSPQGGACSSVRKGNFYGRNYDWFYDESASFIVHSKAVKGRHASLGVAGGNTSLTKEVVQSGEWSESYKSIPFITVDGINDSGVVCNINVVPTGDKGHTTGTNPSAEESLCEFMLVRYVLDYANSAEDAVNKIKGINWYAVDFASAGEVHFMIADETATYIVEFVENEMVIFSDVADDEYPNIPNAAIMTNFYIDGWDGDIVTGFDVEGGIDPTDTTLTSHAEGLERYTLIQDEYDEINSADDMIATMKKVRYTKAGSDRTEPFWYSELVGNSEEYGDFTIYQNAEDFELIKERWIDSFANRQRDGKTWHTVHTSVYDINKKKLIVIPQENDNDKVEFKLTVPGKTLEFLYEPFDVNVNYPEESVGGVLKSLLERGGLI